VAPHLLTCSAAHQAAFVQKIFVLNFITSYLGIFLTAFIYLPFANLLVPYLDVFQITAQKFTAEGKPIPTMPFKIDAQRLTKQVIYFTTTAQIVNFLLELIVPYVQRRVFRTVKEVQTEFATRGEKSEEKSQESSDEAAFLRRVKNEAELPDYDVTVDYREMVLQFGYLSLFSVVWPLSAVSFLINNWFEARGDALKIALSSKRPIPWRADSIGPWLSSLGFLSWLGSLTSAAIVFLFRRNDVAGDPSGISAVGLLLAVFFAEHIYMAAQYVVRYVVKKVDSPGLQMEKAERFALRKQLLAETLGQDVSGLTDGPGVSGAEKQTMAALANQKDGSIEARFWQQQPSKEATIETAKQKVQEVSNPSLHARVNRHQKPFADTSTQIVQRHQAKSPSVKPEKSPVAR
jgi:anoctamin-10